MKRLTPRQALVLRTIWELCATDGAPTLRELATALGIRSPNGVECHLRALERKGRIQRRAHKARSIRLVASG